MLEMFALCLKGFTDSPFGFAVIGILAVTWAFNLFWRMFKL